MAYLMESRAEGERLAAQTQAGDIVSRLRSVGILPGMAVLDAGCGSGAVAREIGRLVGPSGTVIGIDGSAERLALAEAELASLGEAGPHFRLQQGDVRKLDLPDESVDFAWTQYVLEYLAEPQAALRELVRVTRHGGLIAAADIDGLGLGNWPSSPALESGFPTFIKALSEQGFDLWVGRKIFGHLRALGLREVRVLLDPFYISAGSANSRLLEDWSIRFDALAPAVTKAFGGVEQYRAFCDAYLEMLRSPDSLKYAVVLTTVGLRP